VTFGIKLNPAIAVLFQNFHIGTLEINLEDSSEGLAANRIREQGRVLPQISFMFKYITGRDSPGEKIFNFQLSILTSSSSRQFACVFSTFNFQCHMS
jgi:hypothetical protein